MNKEQLDAIANRKTTCHPFGETVTLSRAERDQLVALAHLAMNPTIREAIEATFEQRPGYLKLISAAFRALPEAAEIGKNREKV
ncbi:hypothetical protein ACOTH8_21585 [Achromobacter xylosoxidans]